MNYVFAQLNVKVFPVAKRHFQGRAVPVQFKAIAGHKEALPDIGFLGSKSRLIDFFLLFKMPAALDTAHNL